MNEGMENLTQIAELENKVGYAVNPPSITRV